MNYFYLRLFYKLFTTQACRQADRVRGKEEQHEGVAAKDELAKSQLLLRRTGVPGIKSRWVYVEKVGAYLKFTQMHLVVLLTNESEMSGRVAGYIWKRFTVSALSQPTLCHEVQGFPARSHAPLSMNGEVPWSQTKDPLPKRSALMANIQYHRASTVYGFTLDNSRGKQYMKPVAPRP